MKRTKLKFIGVCAVALMSVSALSPSVLPLFGADGIVAEAASTDTYLRDVNYQTGTFSNSDWNFLSVTSGVDVTTEVPASSSGILKKLFPNAPAGRQVVQLLDLTNPIVAGSPVYTVYMKTNVTSTAGSLIDLNEVKDATYTITFEVIDSTSNKLTRTATLTISSGSVVAENITKSLEDHYNISDGLTVTDVDNQTLTHNSTATTEAALANGEYFVIDIDTPTFEAGYVNGAGLYDTVVSNKTQNLEVVYRNSAGRIVRKYVSRTISVVPATMNMPILELRTAPSTISGGGVYFQNGETIPTTYAYTMLSLNSAPMGGAAQWIKTNVLGSTLSDGTTWSDNSFTVANVDHSILNDLVAKGGTSPSTYYANLTASQISINADNVDLQTPGTYHYTVTLTNGGGAVSEIKVPIIVYQADNLPVYTFLPGHSADMTIEAGTSFDPFEGVIFRESLTSASVIPDRNIAISGSVDTTKPGTYKLNYTATNSIGNTVTLTRTITVVTSGEITAVPVYRAYNPNNGDQLYTTSRSEYNGLVALGWTGEGLSFNAASAGVPVYRLYNPNSGEHFYTTNLDEYNSVGAAGWNKEGIAFYSSTSSSGVEVFRLFNPNAGDNPGSHYYTKDSGEKNWLVGLGWVDEGVGFYAFS